MKSWVLEAELTKYNHKYHSAALLAKSQPAGHVAYVSAIDVSQIVLMGPAVAELDGGFLTKQQHDSTRYHLSFPAGQMCFGSSNRNRNSSNKTSSCPLCLR